MINLNKKYLENFKASTTWITKFKNSNRLVSRKITYVVFKNDVQFFFRKFVSRTNFTKKDQLKAASVAVINDIKALVNQRNTTCTTLFCCLLLL